MRGKFYICIPQATEKGYIECPLWGVFDWSYTSSVYRRGRVQDGGRVSPTVTCSGDILYAFVSYEKD